MRFYSSTRPTLTPLGQRLLALSSAKLSSLDYPAPGARDEAHLLRRGVLVREAIRSAWRSVDDGSHAAFTNWHAPGAQALGAIGEEDEDEDEFAAAVAGPQTVQPDEERWFEDLVSGLSSGSDEDDDAQPGIHEWLDSTVSVPDADEYEYEYEVEDMVAYTLPSAPISAPPATAAQLDGASYSVEVMSPDDCTFDLVDGDMLAVDDLDAGHETDYEYADDDGSEPPSPPEAGLPRRLRLPYANFRMAVIPPQPVLHGLAVVTPHTAALYDSESDLDDLADPTELALPPPLIRSRTAGSSPSSSEDEGSCVTPPRSVVSLDGGRVAGRQKPHSWEEPSRVGGLGLELGTQALAA